MRHTIRRPTRPPRPSSPSSPSTATGFPAAGTSATGRRGPAVTRPGSTAVNGALDQIAPLGGGRIEDISELTTRREAPGRLLIRSALELPRRTASPAPASPASMSGIVSKVVEPA